MFAMFMQVALAAPTIYNVEVSVPTGPVLTLPNDSPYVVSRVFKHLAPGTPDTVVSSTSPYIRCEIKDEAVHVIVTMDQDNWPDLPSSADCEWGNDYIVRVEPVEFDDDHAWSNSPIVIVPGERLVIEKPKPTVGFRIYELPSGGTYSAGVTVGVKGGNPWQGLSCESGLGSDGVWYVKIDISSDNLAYGNGYCKIGNAKGMPYTLPLKVRLP